MDVDKNSFSGDVLLVSTPDGGDIVVEDGLIQDCRNFDTAVYLSLFGGNRNDLDGRPKETWWGNLISGTKRNEWMQSEFGAMVTGLPLTSGNLRRAGEAAKRDLQWIQADAGADDITVRLSAEQARRVTLFSEITRDGQHIGGGAYEFQWQEAVS
ncbi:MAG: hypothetical protein IJH36_04230 [Clostridia bacterium]|nr:hypothetical protein [Clostridia bacterium]